MEAENTLTLPQETINEIFFKEEARRIYEAFPNSTDPDQLHHLHYQLQCIKMLLTHLVLPWDRFIPVLFRSFAIYMKHSNELTANPKVYQHATQLIDCMSYLSQQNALISHMVSYFDYQIKELDKLKAESSSSAE